MLGRPDLSTIGGHVKAAEAFPTLEVWLMAEDVPVERGRDDETGLDLLDLWRSGRHCVADNRLSKCYSHNVIAVTYEYIMALLSQSRQSNAKVPRSPRIGVLLGAGGVLGGAWLAGALAALARVTGWEPRQADVILGTSAGAVFAAVLAAGLSSAQVFPAASAGAAEDAVLIDLALEKSYRASRRWPRILPGSLGLAARAMRDRALLGLLSGLLPRGLVATTTIEAAIARVVPKGWAPHPACWIVASDYGTGDRVVFGRPEAPLAPLARGVAASCAIPGFFEPVGIGGRWYVDGGLRSMSNADLLAGQGLDVVIVLNPMSGRARPRGWALVDRMMAAVREWSAARLDAEVARLQDAGTTALVIEPTETDLEAIGPRVMDARRTQRVAELARETTAAQLRPVAGRWTDVLAAAS